MEMIQNADDNQYAQDTIPTISIKVFPKYVKIECNEAGFTEENIQALCRTGRSSKKPGQGYTGEKGIGFKSVFKLAHRAHVRSGHYFFQLDQRRELGMITPQWDEDFFKQHKKSHQTTIILDRICEPSTDFATALKKEVDMMDPALILFLRRIQRFHMTLFESPLDNQPAIAKHFRRSDWNSSDGLVSLIDEDTDVRRRFYKHQHSIEFKGVEPRREGISETDIVLAFPVKRIDGKMIPKIGQRNLVFAYLPLGNFGFKVFALHH